VPAGHPRLALRASPVLDPKISDELRSSPSTPRARRLAVLELAKPEDPKAPLYDSDQLDWILAPSAPKSSDPSDPGPCPPALRRAPANRPQDPLRVLPEGDRRHEPRKDRMTPLTQRTEDPAPSRPPRPAPKNSQELRRRPSRLDDGSAANRSASEETFEPPRPETPGASPRPSVGSEEPPSSYRSAPLAPGPRVSRALPPRRPSTTRIPKDLHRLEPAKTGSLKTLSRF
jgi:hypothetical protein